MTELEGNQKKAQESLQREPVSQNKIEWEKRKESEKEIRKVKTQITKCESEIERLENEMKTREGMMADPAKYQKEIQDGSLYRAYEEIKLMLSREMKRWEELNYELEILER